MRVRTEVLGNMGLALDKQGQDIWRKLQLAHPVALEPQELQAISDLGAHVLEANRQSAYVSHPALHALLARRWWSRCRQSSMIHDKSVFGIYHRSPLKWQGPLRYAHELRMYSLCHGVGRNVSLWWTIERNFFR